MMFETTASGRGKKPALTGPVGARIALDGRQVILLTANNYLGLANDPEIIEKAWEVK